MATYSRVLVLLRAVRKEFEQVKIEADSEEKR
jgi:hypothetical protein